MIASLLSSVLSAQVQLRPNKGETDRDCTVACYYFPNYHVDPRNEAQHGENWTEWELVKGARPRFEGHYQPREPAWGCEDESDPLVMAKKINAAADHGVDVLIFDWYWYDAGPFLEGALERGFLGASNCDRVRFAIMWANHDWVDIHPDKYGTQAPVIWPGKVTPETFDVMTDHIIETYFKHPSYWRLEGRPYFSFYDLSQMVANFGSCSATRAALGRFRAKVKAAGFPDLHLNAVVWGRTSLPSEKMVNDPGSVIAKLGCDSVTSYVWIHHVELPDFPATDYADLVIQARAHWHEAQAALPIPYFPNVTMGWDPSPRTVQSDNYTRKAYPWTPIVVGNTPKAFEGALRHASEFLSGRPAHERVLTINNWNEWTEGSYVEPDKRWGMAYLEAIRSVFGANHHPVRPG